ncbi:cilia- and flagella-associated protein 65 [Calliopsis andreniformis]|uniref:cilia- and flagella-associated protein 65 n=1 Tax=Calliopsis andreniformis TaxID=337506 RepID=UPI003FCC3EE0
MFKMNENFSNRAKLVHLDYGEVEVGKTVVKTIEIWNESCKEQVYQVQRDPTTNPLDHVFYLRSYTWMLAPNEKYLCEIRYRPFTVFSKNVDYFSIMNSVGTCFMRIMTLGSSIGPEVTCSTTDIVMHCTKKNSEIKRRVKLKNNSKVPAIFMFDIDERSTVFKLNIKEGLINPHSYKYVTITFTPIENESYTYHLPILILNQEPIILNLYGYCSSFKEESSFTYPWKEKNGFKGYMSDCANTAGDLPPVSLSKNYFDFGQVDTDIENLMHRIPHAICLTNHSSTNLSITWEQDVEGIFNITPCEMQVQAKQSVLFELLFNPSVKNNLFGREIIGSIFFKHKKQSFFPFTTSIRMIGHSFPAASNGWIPQYDMPQTVIMPACVPSFPVYTTFLIKKFGHLPLMFQFVPPPTSHFTVKPMLGVIYQNYQIIAIEMTPECKNEQIYIERWTIFFNGNKKNESYIDFKGYAEYANIMFCNSNGLTFAPVFPGCQQFEKLGIRNITRHTIKYTFYHMPPELDLEYPSREITSNDTLIQECIFQPVEPNINYDFELQCVLVVVKNGVPIGSKSCISLRVRGRSQTGSLVAIPKELNFGELEYNSTKTLSFDLFNFSSVNIYYKLICTHSNWPLGNIEKDVTVRPTSETAFSNSHNKIIVSITPHTPGYYQFAIQYLIRVSYRSDTLLSKQKPIKVCNVHCMCILPILKVRNACAIGCKQKYSLNISKPFLWRTLQINRLNTILENILPGEKKTLTINLFPMVLNKGILFIKLIMMNCSTLPVSWSLKRIHQCGCKPVIKKRGCSFQKEVIECVHQTLCVLCPETGLLKPKEDIIISMKVSYTLLGKSEISWDLDVGYNRHVILKILIDCLPEFEKQYDFLNPRSINFGQIYFGNKEAVYKAYWINNITNNDLSYSVNINNICKLNQAYHCEVFSCLNQNGIIEAQTAKPLVLKFQPRMFGAYKVTLPITLGEKTMDLVVKADACCDFRSTLIDKPLAPACACKASLFPVYYNSDCIDMWTIPTYSSIVRMLFIYNNLNYDALAYEWKCHDVPKILHVEVFPRKGIMSPNAVQSFRVKICSKGQPCTIDVNISCEFLNASERRDYQRSIIKYNILSEELDGQFVITEKGTRVPKPWFEILDKPELYCKVLTLRCSIYPVEDECIRVNLIEELKTAPSNTIHFNKSNSCNNTIQNEKERSIITFILESLLWDIVSSRQFKKTLEESLIPRKNLYYSQFMMDLSERKRLIQRSYISPPLAYIDSILEEMLYTIVHEEFSIEITHLIPEQDARHINYIKTLPKQNQPNMKLNFYKQLYDSDIVNINDMVVNPRMSTRVSFLQ